ncbi:MAG: hypothetical protein KJ941_08245 [Bacteroidetes bacterium]|nr:hypothetical protein [Bacteroidota bacterium]
MKFGKKSGITLLVCAAVALSACKKKKETEEASEIAKQNAIAENVFNDAQFMADEAARGAQAFKSFSSDCVVLSYDTTGGKIKVTIDFGPEDCLCNDGKKRRGKVFVDYTGPVYSDVGNIITFTTEDYFVNSNNIEGIRVVTHSDVAVYNIESEGTITLANDAGVLTWKSSRVRTQTAGTTTYMLQDDEFSITGNASGVSAAGKDYLIEITKPLAVQLGCRWIKSGTFEIESGGLEEKAKIDFGTGDCDNYATLTYKGKAKEINL